MKKTLKFELERETKNTYRYKEITEGTPPVVNTIYIQKWALKEPATELIVTIETSVGEES